MRKISFILITLISTFSNFNAQNQERIDTLIIQIAQAADDSNKVKLIYSLARQYDPFKSKHHIENFIIALNLAKKISYTNGIKKLYVPLINNLFYKEMYDVSLNYCLEYLEFCEKEGLSDEKYFIYNMMGNLLTKQGKYEEALKYYNKKRIYDLQKEDYRSYASSLNNMSLLFSENKQYDSSLVYSFWAAEIFKRNNMAAEMANSILGISEAYIKKEHYDKAKEKANEALSIYTAINQKHGMCIAYYDLGCVYAGLNKPDSAFNLFSRALQYADSLNLIKMQRDCYKSLSEMYFKLKNYKDAYEYHILSGRYEDSIAIDRQRGKMLEIEVNYDLAKKENQLKDKEFEIKAKNRQKNILLIGITGVILLLGISYKAYHQKKKSNEIISSQKKLVEEKQKEVLDSIKYAQRIQQAMLASENLLKTNLQEHFVLFKPKDLVSGDFYWGSNLSNGTFALVTADSTGHGVPGAIMSMLNIACLNESVTKDQETLPDRILDAARTKIIEHLSNDGSAEGGKDGMDCTICCFDMKDLKLTYASAHNDFYILRNKELIHCSADKMPVGKSPNEHKPFTYNQIQLQKDDIVYTFTDGFADQFGGPKGKKFKYKQLEQLFIQIAELPLKNQRDSLEKAFNEWKGDLEQVDDVCVIGVKI